MADTADPQNKSSFPALMLHLTSGARKFLHIVRIRWMYTLQLPRWLIPPSEMGSKRNQLHVLHTVRIPSYSVPLHPHSCPSTLRGRSGRRPDTASTIDERDSLHASSTCVPRRRCGTQKGRLYHELTYSGTLSFALLPSKIELERLVSRLLALSRSPCYLSCMAKESLPLPT